MIANITSSSRLNELNKIHANSRKFTQNISFHTSAFVSFHLSQCPVFFETTMILFDALSPIVCIASYSSVHVLIRCQNDAFAPALTENDALPNFSTFETVFESFRFHQRFSVLGQTQQTAGVRFHETAFV